jgi:hypothetical protein
MPSASTVPTNATCRHDWPIFMSLNPSSRKSVTAR